MGARTVRATAAADVGDGASAELRGAWPCGAGGGSSNYIENELFKNKDTTGIREIPKHHCLNCDLLCFLFTYELKRSHPSVDTHILVVEFCQKHR